MEGRKEKPGVHCNWKEEYMKFKEAVIARNAVIEQYERSSLEEHARLEQEIAHLEATAEWLRKGVDNQRQNVEAAASKKPLLIEQLAKLQAELNENGQQQIQQFEAIEEKTKAAVERAEMLLYEEQMQADAQRWSCKEVQPPADVLELERQAQASFARRKEYWHLQDRAEAWLKAAPEACEDEVGPRVRSRKRGHPSSLSARKPTGQTQAVAAAVSKGSMTVQQDAHLAALGGSGCDERSMLLNVVAEMKVPLRLSPLPPTPPRDGKGDNGSRFQVALPELPSESPWVSWSSGSPPEPVPESTPSSEPSRPTWLLEARLQTSREQQLEPFTLEEPVVPLDSPELPQVQARVLEQHVREAMSFVSISAPKQVFAPEVTLLPEPSQLVLLSEATMQESQEEQLELATSSILAMQDFKIDPKEIVVTSAPSEKTLTVLEHAEQPMATAPVSAPELWSELTHPSEPPQPRHVSEAGVRECLEEQLELVTSKLEQQDLAVKAFKEPAVTSASSALSQERAVVLEHVESAALLTPISPLEPKPELTSPSELPLPTWLAEARVQESLGEQLELANSSKLEQHCIGMESHKNLVTSASSELPQETAVVVEHVEESVVPGAISAPKSGPALEGTVVSKPPQPTWLLGAGIQASLEQLASCAASTSLEQRSLFMQVLEELRATSASLELPQETKMLLAAIPAPEPGSVPKVTSPLEQSESTVQLPQETARELEHTEEAMVLKHIEAATTLTAVSALKPEPVPEVTALPEPSIPTRLLEATVLASIAKQLERATSSELKQQGVVLEDLEEHVAPLASAEAPQKTIIGLQRTEEPLAPAVVSVSALVPEPLPEVPPPSEPSESTLLLDTRVQTSIEEQLESAISKPDGLIIEDAEESGRPPASSELPRELARTWEHVEEPIVPVANSPLETGLAMSALLGPPQTEWLSGLFVLGQVAESAARYELKEQNFTLKEPMLPLPASLEHALEPQQESAEPVASSEPAQPTAVVLLQQPETVPARHPEAAVAAPGSQPAAAASPAEQVSRAKLPTVCPMMVGGSMGMPLEGPTVSTGLLREEIQADKTVCLPGVEHLPSEEPPSEGEHRAVEGGEPWAELPDREVLKAELAVASELIVVKEGVKNFRDVARVPLGAMQQLRGELQQRAMSRSSSHWQSAGVAPLLVRQPAGPSQEQGMSAVCQQQSVGSCLHSPGSTGTMVHEMNLVLRGPDRESPTSLGPLHPCHSRAQEHNGQPSDMAVPVKQPHPVHPSGAYVVSPTYAPRTPPRSVSENLSRGASPTVPITSRLSEIGYSLGMEERQEGSEAATAYADFLQSDACPYLSKMAESEISLTKELKVLLGKLRLAMQSHGVAGSLVDTVLEADRNMFVCAVLILLDRCMTNPVVAFALGKCKLPLFTKTEELLLTALVHVARDGQAALLCALRVRFCSSRQPKRMLAQGAYVRLMFALCRRLGEVALARTMVWELMHSDCAPFLLASAVGAWPSLLSVWPQGVVRSALSYMLYRRRTYELSDTLMSQCSAVLQEAGPLPVCTMNLRPLAADLLDFLLTPHQCLGVVPSLRPNCFSGPDTCTEHRVALKELSRQSPKTVLPWVLRKQLVPKLQLLLPQLELPLVEPHAVCLVKLLGELWTQYNKVPKILNPLLEQMAGCLARCGSPLRCAVIEAFQKLPGFNQSRWAAELHYWFQYQELV